MAKLASIVFVLLLLSFPAAGCGPASEPPPPSEISDSAGWTLVQSGAPTWGEGRAWTVPPEPELVIGVLEGSEEYQLVEVADAGRFSDGRVVVVDRGSQTVRLYGPLGAFQQTLGGPGAGPGEFTNPVSVLVTAGDTLIIWDQALLRATRFTPSGGLAAVSTVDWGKLASNLNVEVEAVSRGGKAVGEGFTVPSGLYPGPMRPLADGGYLVRLVGKEGSPPGLEGYRPPSGAIRVAADLSVIDTLMFFGDVEQAVVEAPWGPFSVTPPGAMVTQIAYSAAASRICVGDQEGPEISCFHRDGKKTILRWASEPLPLNREQVSAWREESLRLLGPKMSRDQILTTLDEVPIPEFRPSYGEILLDPVGNLWVERGSSGQGSGDSNDFLVFDPQGVLLGTVSLPPVRVMAIGLDYVLGVYEDELEIEYVHLYKLQKPEE